MPKDRKNAQENLPLPKKKKNWAIHIIDSAKKKKKKVLRKNIYYAKKFVLYRKEKKGVSKWAVDHGTNFVNVWTS